VQVLYKFTSLKLCSFEFFAVILGLKSVAYLQIADIIFNHFVADVRWSVIVACHSVGYNTDAFLFRL